MPLMAFLVLSVHNSIYSSIWSSACVMHNSASITAAMLLVQVHKSLKKILKDFNRTRKSWLFRMQAAKITCSRWLGSKVLLLNLTNFTFSWQSSADLMLERINNWSIQVKRRDTNVYGVIHVTIYEASKCAAKYSAV